MDSANLRQIKKIAMLALFSDDYLMDRLVLKGGNLLDLVYQISSRASIDLDFSLQTDFPTAELPLVEQRILAALTSEFSRDGYTVFDVVFCARPRFVKTPFNPFWGGYRIEFKVARTQDYDAYKGNRRRLVAAAAGLGEGMKKSLRIDISKFERCERKQPREVDGQTIFVYSPEMMVFEKLRAICQQMPEYAKVYGKSCTARARDFFDICTILDNFRIDLLAPDNVALVRDIFAAKKVPMRLVGDIPLHREYHRPDFEAVQSTAKPGTALRDFDFYFDKVIHRCVKPLEPLWIAQPPAS